MAEKKGVMTLSFSTAFFGYVVLLGLLLLVAQCSAVDNPDCYVKCLDKCRKTRNAFGSALCGGTCSLNCYFNGASLVSVPKDNHYFCKLGCASSLCSNLLNQENPEVEKMGGCVDSCSDRCATMTT